MFFYAATSVIVSIKERVLLHIKEKGRKESLESTKEIQCVFLFRTFNMCFLCFPPPVQSNLLLFLQYTCAFFLRVDQKRNVKNARKEIFCLHNRFKKKKSYMYESLQESIFMT